MCINIDWCAPLNPRHLTFLGGITTFFPTTAMCQGKSRKNEHMYSLDIFICEVSPKFNCCKMEYPLILRFKGPLRFSMFRTRLSRKLAWPCVFLNGLRDFSCRAPFWRPCTFACVPARFFQSVFVAPLQHGHSSRGGSACMFLRMDGQCF